MGYHQRMPPQFVEVLRRTHVLADHLGVPYASSVMNEGLYVATRAKRDPVNNNRKRQYLTVRLRRGNVEVFRSEEAVATFPTDFLITQLMLVK